MIRATIHHTVETTVKKDKKAKEESAVIKQENVVVTLQDLKNGDGAAQVERGRQLRLALPFGAAAITSTCDVRLTCNQDKATVKRAAKAAMKLVDAVLEDDLDDMERFLDDAERKMKEGDNAKGR